MWEYIVCGVIVLIAVIALVWFLIHMMTKKSPKSLGGGKSGISLVYDKGVQQLQNGQYGVYFSPGCGWCNKLKQELSSVKSGPGIEVLMFNVAQSPEHQKGLMQVSPTGGVPAIVRKMGNKVTMVQAGYSGDIAKKIATA